MFKACNLAALALVSVISSSLVYAEDKPVAVVNGVAIPQERMEMRLKSAAAQGQPDTPEIRSAIRDELISLELVAQEALKKGLDKQAEVAEQLHMTRQSVLATAFMQDYLKNHPITDDTLKQEYETLKLTTGGKEYKARHILVKTEGEAKSIVQQLKKKAKFDKLASKHSLDPGSKNNGGELGWSLPSAYVQSFAEALEKLKKGAISAPVQSNFGWHIIKLDDVRDFNFPAFQEVRQNLLQRSQQQAAMNAVDELRASAKIE